MKKSTITIVVVIVIIIIAIIIFGGASSGTPLNPSANNGTMGTSTPSAPIATSETTKVSSSVLSYQNDELGFSIKYPNTWEKVEASNGISFLMPIDKSQVSTIATLKVDISVGSGKCSFPPVTTIQDRGTLAVGSNTLNMISMSNSVQGRNYFNRMYSLQKGDVCYTFAFASIAQSPSTKNLTGSNVTQAQNNNKAIISTADAAFTEMVKSFAFVTGPQGKDETSVVPTKK